MGTQTLQLTTLKEMLRWYELNLCNVNLVDPRGYRVRFLRENFIHLIHLKNKYGGEPKNARLALEEIERGRITLKPGRFDAQRTTELPRASEIATHPDLICTNWQDTRARGRSIREELWDRTEPSISGAGLRGYRCAQAGGYGFPTRVHRRHGTSLPGMALKSEGAARAARSTLILAPGQGIAENISKLHIYDAPSTEKVKRKAR